MQKNGFHENVSYNSFALSPRFIVSCLVKKYFSYFHWIMYNEYSNEGTVLGKRHG